MLRAHIHSLENENSVRRIEIELRTLQNLHNQLQNVMTQASLIICFSLAALSSDNLTALGNDTSRFCVYKDGLHYWTALAFLCSSCMCICLCALLVVLCSFVQQRSQTRALDLNAYASVALTHRQMTRIYLIYASALLFFLGSAVLVMWLFIGLDNYRVIGHTSDYKPGILLEREETGLLYATSTGEVLTPCLDPHNSTDLDTQVREGSQIAATATIVIGFAFTFGTAYVLFVRREYEKIHLLRWYKTQKKRDQDEDNQTQKMMHIELHTMEQPNEGPGALISSGGAV